MVDLVTLLEGIAAAIRSCPEVRAELDDVTEAIIAYTDIATSDANNLSRTVYMAPNGSIVVAWMSTDLAEGEMQAWSHNVEIYVRALRQKSPLRLLNAILDGIPDGSDLRWRFECVNEFILPMQVLEVVRQVDEEGIDSYLIKAAFREKGDDPYGVSG